jgi:chromosomal replication initiation ATPase DnaA
MSTVGAIPVGNVTDEIAEEFTFEPQETHGTFPDVGFGPFVVRRDALVEEIIAIATPRKSVHISGCKGAGKTTLLHQLGQHLTNNNAEVYFFPNASEFNREYIIRFVKALAKSRRVAYLLVDETQQNTGAALFTLLLKNNTGHALTTIGAGVRSGWRINDKHAHDAVSLNVY